MSVKARDNKFSYPSLSLSLSLSLYAQVNLQSRLPSVLPSASASPALSFVSRKEIKYSTTRIKLQLRGALFVFSRELKLYYKTD